MCFCASDKIVDEVRRIMGPSVSYNSAVCGMSSSEIPRRLKRKGKYQLAVEKYAASKRKPHPNAYTFQKKLCVFRFQCTQQFHTVNASKDLNGTAEQ